jgi:hypothetical protein
MLEDERFCKVGPRQFGLREWGGEAYTTIADKIAEYIDKQGGNAFIEDIVSVLTSKFSVSENSVRSYCGAVFSHDPVTGIVSMRSNDQETIIRRREPLLTRGVFLIRDAFVFRWELNGNLSSGTPLPAACAQLLGLKRGDKINRWFNGCEITFSWPSAQPAVGSRSSLIRHYRLSHGDYLFLELAKHHAGRSFCVRQDDIASLPGVERAAETLAWRPRNSGDIESKCGALEHIGGTLGLDIAAPDLRQQVRMRLADRGEEKSLALVSPYGQR